MSEKKTPIIEIRDLSFAYPTDDGSQAQNALSHVNLSIEDGSYIRLKDISLSYSLPENVCKKLKMKQFDISVNASNLLTWTNYSGYDPEVNTSTQTVITGLDNGAFPKSRVYTLGVKLIF